MTTITARFVDRNAMSEALLALAGDDIHTKRMDFIHAPVRAGESPPAGASLGSTLGAVAAGAVGVVAVVASGGALLAAGTVVAAVASAAAGGMAGGVVGALAGGKAAEGHDHEGHEDAEPVVITLEVGDAEADQTRDILVHAGGIVLDSPPPSNRARAPDLLAWDADTVPLKRG